MEKPTIDREQAFREVVAMIRRTALLHYAYAKTLVEELGEERGKELIGKAIRAYGEEIGRAVREAAQAKGLELLPENYREDLPSLGWEVERVVVDGEPRARVRVCHLANVWNELDAPEIGRLYCYVDQAKYEAYSPELACVHERNLLDGDPFCELAVRTKARGTPDGG